MSRPKINKIYALAFSLTLIVYWLTTTGATFFNQASHIYLPADKPYFVDATKESGLYVEVVRDPEVVWIPGGGICWGDYDRDGDLDVYVMGWNLPGRLFRNDDSFRFTDVTVEVGLMMDEILGKRGMSCTWADYDNSGYPSLLLTFYDLPTGNVMLLKNLGNGSFKDVTQEAGLAISRGKYAAGTAWADVNRDGCLDLYVGYYINLRSVREGSIFGQGAGNQLFINNCDGSFTEMAEDYGVVDYGYTFQPVFLDYDGDRFPDLFLANDFGYTRLYKNEGGEKFTRVSSLTGVERVGQWMGVAYGDLDFDGYWEIAVTNYDDNLLLKYTGDYFTDVAPRLRISDPYQVGWGVCIVDIDNNGLLDVVMANGKIGVRTDRPVNQINKLFYNIGPFFYDATWHSGLARHGNARGLACVDLDLDGGVDLLIYDLLGYPILYKNVLSNKTENRWVQVRLEGTTWLCGLCGFRTSRDAVGAVVEIEAVGKVYRQSVAKGISFLSDNGPWLYFGLGRAGKIDRLTVFWPSGVVEEYRDLPVNSVVYIVEQGGCRVSGGLLEHEG
ncbi:MAG: CRTAC1 family protein [Nitrososphaerota archaeon]|nr:CRTAC1 family protein [Candidatus Calditenuaceae archaeon]MDW8073190.1 CRTAC1 family protein [Nitrososphaerota archaeon]